MKYGWDISNHDWGRHHVNLADAKAAGIDLVTHKASEGNWFTDPNFSDYASQLAHTSFPVEGSYHVLSHRIDIEAQVDLWVSTVAANVHWKTHPCWIWQVDAEPLDGYSEPTLAELESCGQVLMQKYGVPSADRIIVYAPLWVYGDTLKGLSFKLWASSYGSNYQTDFKDAFARNSVPWNSYSGQMPAVLQFGSRTQIGSQPTCDANVINVDTDEELRALFGVKPTPVPSFDLLEWIMALPGAPTGLTYQQFLKDLAIAVWTEDVVPAPQDPATGKPDPKNPTWTGTSYLRTILHRLKLTA